MIDNSSLTTQLRTLGLKPGDTIMLHASLRAIGKVLGGPDQVHQAIIDAIGPTGTLMMYVGCEPEYEALGRRELTQADESLIRDKCPAFDSTTARARHDYGALAELFRSWPGVICSTNPGARMAALGGRSVEITSGQPLNYGYGAGSPLAKLYEYGGKLLLLGSDLDQVTLFHYAEHIAPIKEKRIVRFKVPMLKDKHRVWVDVEEYDTNIGVRQWPDRFFATILDKFLLAHVIQSGKVGMADCYLIDAKSLVDYAVPIFVDTASVLKSTSSL